MRERACVCVWRRASVRLCVSALSLSLCVRVCVARREGEGRRACACACACVRMSACRMCERPYCGRCGDLGSLATHPSHACSWGVASELSGEAAECAAARRCAATVAWCELSMELSVGDRRIATLPSSVCYATFIFRIEAVPDAAVHRDPPPRITHAPRQAQTASCV